MVVPTTVEHTYDAWQTHIQLLMQVKEQSMILMCRPKTRHSHGRCLRKVTQNRINKSSRKDAATIGSQCSRLAGQQPRLSFSNCRRQPGGQRISLNQCENINPCHSSAALVSCKCVTAGMHARRRFHVGSRQLAQSGALP